MSDNVKNLLVRNSSRCMAEARMILKIGSAGYSILVYTYLTSQFAWKKIIATALTRRARQSVEILFPQPM